MTTYGGNTYWRGAYRDASEYIATVSRGIGTVNNGWAFTTNTTTYTQPETRTVTFYVVEYGNSYLTADSQWSYLIADAQLYPTKEAANQAAMKHEDRECTIAIFTLSRTGEL